MNKELALFKWLQGFNSESHIYRINHLPSGVNDKYAQVSLDDVVVTTTQEYISGSSERELTYILQTNQKLSKDIGGANAQTMEIRDALTEWLFEQQRSRSFPNFENCYGYRINTEPQMSLAYEVDNNTARFQIMGSISFIEKRRV